MNMSEFRSTSRPVKLAATYRKMTKDETARWTKGENFGNVATASYLRMCVIGAENISDGTYVIEN